MAEDEHAVIGWIRLTVYECGKQGYPLTLGFRDGGEYTFRTPEEHEAAREAIDAIQRHSEAGKNKARW
jgi:hypothetical protein